MNSTLYFPTNTHSLPHYFGSACIMPGKYSENKPEDLQDRFNNVLLLSKKLGVFESNCCLELVLTNEESKEIVNAGEDFYFYPKPLPISRVKAVFFSDKEEMEQTVTNITLSTAFIPNKLCKYYPDFDKKSVKSIPIPKELTSINWKTFINKYDRLLGGFALMRLAKEEYMNYSEHYFSTLSFFNETIENELLHSKQKIDNIFFDVFEGKASFKKLFPYIFKSIGADDLNKITKEENQTIVKDKITRNIDLNKLQKASYIVGVLDTFGVGEESKKKKIEQLILSDFTSEIKPYKAEVIALCYGLNRGYSVFRNAYKSEKIKKDVKFKLNSQVDYYTIESLYQFAFYDRKTEGFPYLDSWCPKASNQPEIKRRTDFLILDKTVIGKKKPLVGSKEYTESLFKSFSLKISQFLLSGNLIEVVHDIIKEISADKEDENKIKMKNEKDKLTKDIQLQLHNVDKTLFERIDKNGDGLLDHSEIFTFLDELKKARKSLSDLPKNTLKATPNDDSNSKPEETNNNAQELDKRKIATDILKYQEMPLKSLKKLGLERGISSASTLKKNDLIIELVATSNKSLFENQ